MLLLSGLSGALTGLIRCSIQKRRGAARPPLRNGNLMARRHLSPTHEDLTVTVSSEVITRVRHGSATH
jgi:hypothetical protein